MKYRNVRCASPNFSFAIIRVVHDGLPFQLKSVTMFIDLLYLYPCVSFHPSVIDSEPRLLYCGNSVSSTSIAGISFIFSIVFSESHLCIAFCIGFVFTILFGIAFIFSLPSFIASLTSLHPLSASLTSYRCISVYGILLIDISAGSSLSTRMYMSYVFFSVSISLIAFGRFDTHFTHITL